MSTLRFIKSLKDDKATLLELLDTVVFNNKEISYYESNKTYNTGDIILYPVGPGFSVLQCKNDNVTGPYDSTNWESFSPGGRPKSNETFIVNTIADRDALVGTVHTGDTVIVLTSTDGSREGFLWDQATTTWYKISDTDWSNVNIEWANIVSGPVSTPTQIDTTVTDVSDATSSPSPNTIAKRDGSGRMQAVDPSVDADVSTKKYTNDQDAATLSAAETYADTGDTTTLNAAKSYADTGLATKAPLESPALTGTPTAPTAISGDNSTLLATTAFVAAAIAALVNSSPSTLDTLNELAQALGDDPNFATTMTNALATKAPLASPALTGTPTAPTAVDGTNTTQISTTAFVVTAITNAVNNLVNGAPVTLDTLQEIAAAINNDPVFSTTINNALALKAPLDSPALTGTPTAPTAVAGNSTTQIATTAFVAAALANLVNSAPGTLDTLNELAQALGDDPNFATTMTNALALKAPLDSPALTGSPTAPTPTAGTNSGVLATAAFVQTAISPLVQQTIELTDGEDLNTIVISGFYRVLSSFVNGPPMDGHGQLIVSRGLDTIFQMIVSYDNITDVYIRSGNPPDVGGSGSWSAWKRLVLSDNPVFTGLLTTDSVKAPGNSSEVIFTAGQTKVTITHNFGNTNYRLTTTPNSPLRHSYWENKQNNTVDILIDGAADVDITVDVIFALY